MRYSDEYNALLGKINIQKEIYTKKLSETDTETESKIQFLMEKIKKCGVVVVIYFLVAVSMLGIIFSILTYYNKREWIVYIFIALTIILVIFIGREMFYKFKLNKIYQEKQSTVKEQDEIRNSINNLNDQICSLVLSVITINEHFNELSMIESEELLQLKWEQYTKNIMGAINKKYDYSPTYSDYQEYYKMYEKSYETRKQ